MSANGPRWLRSLTPLGLGLVACVSQTYAASSRYPSPEPEPPSLAAAQPLVSAHLAAFGVEPERDPTQPRLLRDIGDPTGTDGEERSLDRLVLVFADPLDPVSLTPQAFGILRADGQRVRPTRAFLAPADEADERRSVTLLGEFGPQGAPPVAVHVIGPLYAESGAKLEGLDADVTGPTEPDRAVMVERLAASPSRCPGSAQVIRATFTDSLAGVGADDLAAIDLRLADGRTIHPTEFDDQAAREGEPACSEPACLGPSDDNVLDLCVDTPDLVVALRLVAGLFTDPGGTPSAATDILLSSPPPSP